MRIKRLCLAVALLATGGLYATDSVTARASDGGAPAPLSSSFVDDAAVSGYSDERPASAAAVSPGMRAAMAEERFAADLARRMKAAGESLFSYNTLADMLEAGEDSRLGEEATAQRERFANGLMQAAAGAALDGVAGYVSGGAVRRFDLNYRGGGAVEADMLLSLWENGDSLAFGGLSGQSGADGVGEALLGYRFRAGEMMFGVSGQWDYLNDGDYGDFRRYAFGLEAASRYGDVFANVYRAIDAPRERAIDGGDYLVYSADGWDVGAAGGFGLGSFGRADVEARRYVWRRVIGEDLRGSRLRASFAPFESWRLSFDYDLPEDGESKREWLLSFQHRFGQDARPYLGRSAFRAAADPWERRYDRVARSAQRVLRDEIVPTLPMAGFAAGAVSEVAAGDDVLLTVEFAPPPREATQLWLEASGDVRPGPDYALTEVSGTTPLLCVGARCVLNVAAGASSVIFKVRAWRSSEGGELRLAISESDAYRIDAAAAAYTLSIGVNAASAVEEEESRPEIALLLSPDIVIKESFDSHLITVMVSAANSAAQTITVSMSGSAIHNSDYIVDGCAGQGSCPVVVPAGALHGVMRVRASLDVDHPANPEGDDPEHFYMRLPSGQGVFFAASQSADAFVEIADAGTVSLAVKTWADFPEASLLTLDFTPPLPADHGVDEGFGFSVSASLNYHPESDHSGYAVDFRALPEGGCEAAAGRTGGGGMASCSPAGTSMLMYWQSSVSGRMVTLEVAGRHTDNGVNTGRIPGYRLVRRAVAAAPAFPAIKLEGGDREIYPGEAITVTIDLQGVAGWLADTRYTVNVLHDSPRQLRRRFRLAGMDGLFCHQESCFGTFTLSSSAQYRIAVTPQRDSVGRALTLELTPNLSVRLDEAARRVVLTGSKRAIGFPEGEAVVHENSLVAVTVRTTAPAVAEFTVTLGFGGDAVRGEDYIVLANEHLHCPAGDCYLGFPPGVTQGVFTVSLIKDDDASGESIEITLSPPSNFDRGDHSNFVMRVEDALVYAGFESDAMTLSFTQPDGAQPSSVPVTISLDFTEHLPIGEEISFPASFGGDVSRFADPDGNALAGALTLTAAADGAALAEIRALRPPLSGGFPFTLEIALGDGEYKLSSGKNILTVVVLEENSPIFKPVGFASSTRAVTAGDSATVAVFFNPPVPWSSSAGDVLTTVSLHFSGDADILAGDASSNRRLVIPDLPNGESLIAEAVFVFDTKRVARAGTITIALPDLVAIALPDSVWEYQTGPNRREFVLEILPETPEVGFDLATLEIKEGAYDRFAITIDPPLDEDLAVTLRIGGAASATLGFGAGADYYTSLPCGAANQDACPVTIPAGGGRTVFILTHADQEFEGEVVEMAIVGGAAAPYKIAPDRGRIEIALKESFADLVFWRDGAAVSAADMDIDAGASFTVAITLSESAAADLKMTVDYAEHLSPQLGGGCAAVLPGSCTVNGVSGDRTMLFQFRTDRNFAADAAGGITLRRPPDYGLRNGVLTANLRALPRVEILRENNLAPTFETFAVTVSVGGGGGVSYNQLTVNLSFDDGDSIAHWDFNFAEVNRAYCPNGDACQIVFSRDDDGDWRADNGAGEIYFAYFFPSILRFSLAADHSHYRAAGETVINVAPR